MYFIIYYKDIVYTNLHILHLCIYIAMPYDRKSLDTQRYQGIFLGSRIRD